MSVRMIQQKKIIWYHIDEINQESLEFLKNKNFKFHPLDIKDVEGQAEETKLDVYNNYLFLVVRIPFLHRSTGRINSVELDVFMGADFLITIQKGKYKTMRDFYYRARNKASFRLVCFNGGSGYLLYRIMDRLYQDTKFLTNYVDKKVRELEDKVYGDEINENTAREIAYLRRKILSLKRIFEPHREALETLSKLKTSFFPEDLNVYFDDIDDYVEKVWNFLDNKKYAMKDLLEVHDSLLTHTTNKVIKVLTVISVSILPLTLLSGIYGMNIDLPFSHSPMAIWSMFFALLLLIFVVVLVFKKKKWL